MIASALALLLRFAFLLESAILASLDQYQNTRRKSLDFRPLSEEKFDALSPNRKIGFLANLLLGGKKSWLGHVQRLRIFF